MVYVSEISNLSPVGQRGELETRVYSVMDELGISFERVDNDSIETMKDCEVVSNKLGAEIRKSVFVRDQKKTNFYLVIMPSNKAFNTKVFCEKIGCSRVSFASPEYINEFLGVQPGTITVMSLLNDVHKKVKVVIDRSVVDDEWFACNPGANTTHIKFKTEDLLNKFLPHTGHKAIIKDL